MPDGRILEASDRCQTFTNSEAIQIRTILLQYKHTFSIGVMSAENFKYEFKLLIT
jgi:hypothetical protein